MKNNLPCSTPALLHPMTLVALALWAINDHLLKGWGPPMLTGKLSDVTGLMVCPILLVGMAEWCAPALVRRRPHTVLATCCAAVGLFLIGLELFAPVELLYEYALSHLYQAVQDSSALLGARRGPAVFASATADVTDLLCLPALALPWWLVLHGVRRHSRAAGSTPVTASR